MANNIKNAMDVLDLKKAIQLLVAGWFLGSTDGDVEQVPFILREMAKEYAIEIRKNIKENGD